MKMLMLSGEWKMRCVTESQWLPAIVPGSVYADLLDAGEMQDPFWRDNEMAALALMEKDYEYLRLFEVNEALLARDRIVLHCDGLDTLAELYLNGHLLGAADNMHRTFEFNVKPLLLPGQNALRIHFHSPNRAIRERYAENPANGSADAMEGFPLLRKAHCMFGWDWGPRLPDAGIWRDLYLLAFDHARLEDVHIRQQHLDGRVRLSVHTQIESAAKEGVDKTLRVEITVTAPDGAVFTAQGMDATVDIASPQLWWPNGLGGQPLYTVEARLSRDGETLDSQCRRIGLRTMTIRRQKDEWGESFAHEVNGVCFFAMGADYIPEDNILRRVTPERTRTLLEDATSAHFNVIRVWGGGYYPDDFFYDICDDLGLVVWQDLMFSCAVYNLTEDFDQSIRHEIADNVRRLRHHASLGLWCGNNEMEMFMGTGRWEPTPIQKSDYVKMYEYIFPALIKDLDPDTFYWPASPSSGGGFDDPNNPSRGDVHYWDVWHGNKPFTDYRKYKFRYASEFGFQSFPCLPTVESFTLPEDRNIFSYVMEKHQRDSSANGKILRYMSQMYRFPANFEMLLYASQLLQAQAIQYGVEHWRRYRGECMGAIIWQLNDCWPVASWSSIDYFGRWKALHYYAKRFFAPVLISCKEEGILSQNTNVNAEPFPLKKSAALNVSNETMEAFTGDVVWSVRAGDGTEIRSGRKSVEVSPMSALWLDELPLCDMDIYRQYFAYQLIRNGAIVGEGTVLLCPPKHFHFHDPMLALRVEGNTLTVSAKAYARSVEVYTSDGDLVLSDNYFDLTPGEKTIQILRGTAEGVCVRSVYDIANEG